MRTPDFWQRDTFLSRLLTPLSVLWCWGAEYRQSGVESYRPCVPVICIGNIVAGGTGKTPTVLAVTQRLQQRGLNVHILTRGYGGSLKGPVQVDLEEHNAQHVGDEPLLLAQAAPTWVAQWRPDGALAAEKAGADVIIMDDGFQNFTIAKDLSLIVVDGAVGFGNGRIMPAGPCREPIVAGRNRAQAAIIIGTDARRSARKLDPLPILPARLVPLEAREDWQGRRVVAFAGIGRPGKFFHTLRDDLGVELVETAIFPDHFVYRPNDLETLIAQAEMLDALPVTTRKDWVRLPPLYRDQIAAIDVRLEFDHWDELDRLLDGVVPK